MLIRIIDAQKRTKSSSFAIDGIEVASEPRADSSVICRGERSCSANQLRSSSSVSPHG